MNDRAHSVAVSGDERPGARQLARGIAATWWYTVSAVVFFEVVLVLSWAGTTAVEQASVVGPIVLGVGGVLWIVSTALLIADHRRRRHAVGSRRWRILLLMLVAVAFGIAAGMLCDSWLLGFTPIAQSLVLLGWPRGVRYRVTIAVTAVLAVLWFIDSRFGSGGEALTPGIGWWLPAFYSTAIPAMTVASLWWWDVLAALDGARTSEARLAATQERLRLATDVHDLQGHHLQVIALQLELAERLMGSDRDAAMEQLRAARASVNDAQQSTRDLAMRYRSVPLGDELANARDLLRAAGIEVTTDIPLDAAEAPESALGPVIRETTTNVLRHGGGRRARLSLARDGGEWRYLIANDMTPDGKPSLDGSGLDGVRRRIAGVGGTLDVDRIAGEFVVVATVPERSDAAR